MYINNNFREEIEQALNNLLPSNSQVKARDYTPEILVDNGVKNLPMLITQKHIKSIVYTLEEAHKLNLPTKNINYHGLGIETLIQVIDNLDNPQAIYQHQGKNYSNDNYVIITSIKNIAGENIIVPIQINAKGNHNNIIIEQNQIKTIYGKRNISNYIKENKLKEVYKKRNFTARSYMN